VLLFAFASGLRGWFWLVGAAGGGSQEDDVIIEFVHLIESLVQPILAISPKAHA
jgi:hypothetical protein